MKTSPYCGHPSQQHGVELHRLEGGKGEGMRLLEARNGLGLELTISLDRNADISRLCYRGINMSYFSPCGYVHPSYYKKEDFLASFTAGFLTTCGLNNVGVPNVDEGESLPLHGTIANTPSTLLSIEENEGEIVIATETRDEEIFSHKLTLRRKIHLHLKGNAFDLEDEILNEGDAPYPVEILYHMNMGYPLLSENAELYIPSKEVTPRNAHAQEGLASWAKMQPPTPNYEEMCYFHSFEKKGLAAIYNPDISQGLAIDFDAANLPYFTEWKMMGVHDYVLGLEPGNCHPDGRVKMREEGRLTILPPGGTAHYAIHVQMIPDFEAFKTIKE